MLERNVAAVRAVSTTSVLFWPYTLSIPVYIDPHRLGQVIHLCMFERRNGSNGGIGEKDVQLSFLIKSLLNDAGDGLFICRIALLGSDLDIGILFIEIFGEVCKVLCIIVEEIEMGCSFVCKQSCRSSSLSP